jgi:prepilin-type N-terminal cleavage/methylation domain-containing protein
MKKTQQEGFTLIEILIVVAIIAILASVTLIGLGPTQQAGRDSRRISDLHEVQTALELYYNKCGFYPGTADCGTNSAVTSWANMTAALTDPTTNIGVTQIPEDPTTGKTYYYTQESGGENYVVGTVFEGSGNSVFNGYVPPSDGVPNGMKSCSKADDEYCLSL